MNTKYYCVCLKRYHANLSLKQGYYLLLRRLFFNELVIVWITFTEEKGAVPNV